jgi:hypothetical protein
VRRLRPNFGDKRTGCCITTTHHLTLPFLRENFWLKTTWLSFPVHPAFLYFQNWRKNWEAAILTPLSWLRQNGRQYWAFSQNTTCRMHVNSGRSAGNGDYFEGESGQQAQS